MTKKYEYSYAASGDEYMVLRKRPDEAMWNALCNVADRDVARDMVKALNRGEFASVEVEAGQELRRKE